MKMNEWINSHGENLETNEQKQSTTIIKCGLRKLKQSE